MKNKENNVEKKFDAMKIFCITILVLKVIWLVIHMNLHYAGALNPWKLGGYAMYTIPSPRYYASIETLESDTDVKIDKYKINFLNLYARGECVSGISKRFYKLLSSKGAEVFIPHSTVRMSIYRKAYFLDKPDFDLKKIGHIVVTTKEKGQLHVKEEFCGKEREMNINGY